MIVTFSEYQCANLSQNLIYFLASVYCESTSTSCHVSTSLFRAWIFVNFTKTDRCHERGSQNSDIASCVRTCVVPPCSVDSESQRSGLHDLLFTACLFHDIGTTDTYDGPLRFEVEGADAAVKHLSQFGVGEQDKHNVWTAIAIHTSPHIAEHIDELSKLVRLAVVTDFGRKTEAWDVLEPMRKKLEEEFERGGIEKVLGDAVVEQAKTKPGKAPMVSWPGVMYKAHLAEPEWEGVNKGF
jgi:hypothetical protein